MQQICNILNNTIYSPDSTRSSDPLMITMNVTHSGYSTLN